MKGMKSTIQIQRRMYSQMSHQEMVTKCKEHYIWPWSAQKTYNPMSFVKAEGCYFWDADGKKYFDMNSQLMCSNIGHGHPKMVKAIKDQAEELCFAGATFATRVKAELGPLLAKHTPGDLNKFFFTLGGAEANENAIKMARLTTGRNKIITRYRSYHGATHGAVILTGDQRRWPNEPGMGGVVRVMDPDKYRNQLYVEGDSDDVFAEKCLRDLEEVIKFEGPQNIAAIFVETVLGTNGVIAPPGKYLQGLRDITKKHGMLLVCDEVMCGLGRTGEWFAVDHWGVVPDIITTAKGLTSGYLPLGCMMVSDRLVKHFDEKPFPGGLTYNGHPMLLGAAIANLKIMEEEDVCGNAKRLAPVLKELHAEMKSKHRCVGDARNIGLFGCLELVANRKTKEPLVPYGAGTSEAMTAIQTTLKQNGVWTMNVGTILHTNPPLTVTEKELREAFVAVDKALSAGDAFIKE